MYIRLQIHEEIDIDCLFSYIRSAGYMISNPDCHDGNSFDIILDQTHGAIAGFDLLWDDSTPNQTLNWITDLQFYGILSKEARERIRSETGSPLPRGYYRNNVFG